MTNEQMQINAAKAMGFYAIQPASAITGTLTVVRNLGGNWVNWNPLKSSADCAEMEDAKEIGVSWGIDSVFCYIDREGAVRNELFFEAEYKDHQNKGAARMYASTMVVAMIGSKI